MTCAAHDESFTFEKFGIGAENLEGVYAGGREREWQGVEKDSTSILLWTTVIDTGKVDPEVS